VIGNTCVQEYAENTKLKADINHYQNAKRRQIKLQHLKELVSDISPQLTNLKDISSSIYKENEEVKELRETLSSIIQSLDNMNRSRKWDIEIRVKKENGKDKEGNKLYEYLPDILGALKGAEYLQCSRYSELYKTIQTIFSAFIKAQELLEKGTLSELSSKNLNIITSQLNENYHINAAHQHIATDKEAFFRLSNLQLLCYLSDDISTRCKLARFILSSTENIDVSRASAKTWLSELDNSYKNKLNATKLSAA